MTTDKIGILISNIGTPDEPTPGAVRRYLKEFLSDPRVIKLPRIIWWPILTFFILPFRAKKSAQLYKKIWTTAGSPQLVNMQMLAKELEQVLPEKLAAEVCVKVGMRYGKPSIQTVLTELRAENISRLLIFPLYPQYSATTTASTFDSVGKVLKQWPQLPVLEMINDYATEVSYIKAVSNVIRAYWQAHGKKYLLFSFHGIPQNHIKAGDPYAARCIATTELLVAELQLKSDEYALSYQSRLGATQWLQPYTDIVLSQLPAKNIKDIQVVCPGFAVDCLETLEEIAIRGKEQFLAAGGNSLQYIPALNAGPSQLEALVPIIASQ